MQSLTMSALVLLSRVRAQPGQPASFFCAGGRGHRMATLEKLVAWHLLRVGHRSHYRHYRHRPLYVTTIGRTVVESRLKRCRRVPAWAWVDSIGLLDIEALARAQEVGTVCSVTLPPVFGCQLTRLNRLYTLWVNGLADMGFRQSGGNLAAFISCSETGLDLLARLDRLVLPEVAAK